MFPADEGPAAGRGETRRGPDAQLAPALVERGELGQAEVRLLQVVPEDLLVLGSAVATLVDSVGPSDEAFVENRARPLEEAPVGRVADQDVPEAVASLEGDSRRLGSDEVLSRERLEELGDIVPNVTGDQLLDRALNEDLPGDACRPIASRSSGLRLPRRAASSAWIVGGIETAGRSPMATQVSPSR